MINPQFNIAYDMHLNIVGLQLNIDSLQKKILML